MANEAQIQQKQAEIATAQAAVRQAMIDIETANTQLRQATISLAQPTSQGTKDNIISNLDNGMDAYESALAQYQTKIAEYNALTDISNYETLRGQLRSAKNTHSQLLFDLKIAKENDEDLTSILNDIDNNSIALEGHLSEFNAINDPRYLINKLNDNTPILLLPVRVESRYMTVKHVQRLTQQVTEANQSINDKKQLWLRFFPDDISIHTHETRLTKDEEKAGHVYWDVVWKDSNDAEAAWRLIVSGYGSERAAYIVKQTEPSNINVAYDPSANQTLNYPSLNLKPAAWTDSPKSKVMPDRFVVRLYRNDNTYREIIGNNISDPLFVGISPEDDESTYSQAGGEIDFPNQTKWMSDFGEAVNAGMGIKIDLEASEENSIKRIIVLGLKLDADKTESTTLIEELVDNHHYSHGGFSFLKQGTPTNNTESEASGLNRAVEGSKESYDVERNGNLFTTATNLDEKKDGQWFADLLGLDTNVFTNIENADSSDILEAIAMNKALWPATMGYYIKQMLQPHISSSERERVRSFFSEFVLGRGKIPAFRVGNQPYGVISSTAFSRWSYPQTNDANIKFYSRLNKNILQPMNYAWEAFATEYVKNITDDSGTLTPSELFMQVIRLHASSVQFDQRYANGTFKMWNLWRFVDKSNSGTVSPKLEGQQISAFLTGYNEHLSTTMATPPKIFELNFLENERKLNGPVIDAFDHFPYSEVRGIQKFPNTEWNYINWLIASTSTIQKIRTEDFSNIPEVETNQKPPKALLYLLLRYAYLQQYLTTAGKVLVDQNEILELAEKEFEFQHLSSGTSLNAEEDALIYTAVKEELTVAKIQEINDQVEDEFSEAPETPRQTKRARHDQLFTAAQNELQGDIDSEFSNRRSTFESETEKWNYINNAYDAVTGESTVEEYLDQLYTTQSGTIPDLTAFKDSLEVLKDLPTARLERAFAEHVDLCSYRLDAWTNGLVNQRLEAQQTNEKGLFIGSFGILEDLEKDTAFPGIHVVEVDHTGNEIPYNPNEEINNQFEYVGSGAVGVQLERDSNNSKVRVVSRVNTNNQGYIHTPSMNHAVTAAILRAGYLSYQDSSATDDALSVNLTSKRVRRALYYLEGLRNGQALPALLGYRFERAIHEKSIPETSLDQYILDIRSAFPLVAGQTIDIENGASIENVEARNVADGLALVNAYEEDNNILDTIVPNTNGHRDAIIEIIDQLMNDVDAISDLMLSESVYQMAKGNSERAGAVLKAIGEGSPIQKPEIVDTPRTGNVLTHRFGIQFNAGDDTANAWTDPEITTTARATAEPALNGWLGKQLPKPENILFKVTFDEGERVVSVQDLQIEPIDFIYMIGDQGNQKDAEELSKRIGYYVKNIEGLADVTSVEITFFTNSGDLPSLTTSPNDANVSLLQLLPLIKTLKNLIGGSRPWTAEDYLLSANADAGIDPDSSYDPATVAVLDPVRERLESVIEHSDLFDYNLEDLKSALNNQLDLLEGLEATDPESKSDFDAATDLIFKATDFGIKSAIPKNLKNILKEEDKTAFIAFGRGVTDQVTIKYNHAKTLLDSIDLALLEVEEANAKLAELGQLVFGRAFKVYPNFQMINSIQIEQNRENANFLDNGGDLPLEKWVQGVAKVRSKVLEYQKMRLFSDALLNQANQKLSATQIPAIDATDRWLGIEIGDNYSPAGDTLSVVMEIPETNNIAGQLQSGMLIDEWVETIPDKNVQTGMAMHFDQPNNEAPNTLILAVTPEETGAWAWDDLMDTINETIGMAKKRAVEPDHIKDKIWGQALPAIIAAISSNDATPSLNFGRNNVNAANGQHGYIKLADYQTS